MHNNVPSVTEQKHRSILMPHTREYLWIERDLSCGHLLVHTKRPVKFEKGTWFDSEGNPAMWTAHIYLELPWLRPGEVAQFELTRVLAP